MTKNRRQFQIAKLLETEFVSSQVQLVNLLSKAGIEATQATVSRDLEDLGAIKVKVPGGELVYAIPSNQKDVASENDHLRRVLSEWVIDVVISSNIVLIKTPPGSAHVVASAMDRTTVDGVLGTVAGDDTVLVVTTVEEARSLYARLSELSGLE
ncbi:MAG: arginine repressor [Actinomycetota bacterium]|nr:arginine repressor [Actinomycetota bacterium]